jgi:hypothetical protein
MKYLLLWFAGFIIFSFKAYAQSENPKTFKPAIEDNSMFIEEAYNQEIRVVQHISNFIFTPGLRDNFQYAFTQEWPAFGLNHQLSYTILYNSLNRGEYSGFGDILLNYRYQLSYKESFIACSPRLSVIIPSGNKNNGLGYGSWGIQANLPLSKRWSDHFINHFNIGTNYLFQVKDKDTNFDKSLVSYFAGISSIWLLTGNFNLMLEILSNLDARPGLNNKALYSSHTIIAPAVRYAIDIKKLQIVPGISVPITLSDNINYRVGAFFYLSFEHEF